jgi:hypothetical protein
VVKFNGCNSPSASASARRGIETGGRCGVKGTELPGAENSDGAGRGNAGGGTG